MTRRHGSVFTLVATSALTLAACSDDKDGPGEGTSTGSTDTSGASSGETTGDSATSMANDTAGDTASDTAGGTDGGEAVCDVWEQDCPEGQKCVPYDDKGGIVWNAVKCVEVVASPKTVGDRCTAVKNGATGLDDCEKGAYCWGADEKDQTGTCTAQCTGGKDAPVCDDPDVKCVIQNEGILNLCLAACDPLATDQCDPGDACYDLFLGGQDWFTCSLDQSAADGGDYGDPCGIINACHAGLSCRPGSDLADCTSETGYCCSSWCDLDDPKGDAQCPDAAEGQTCQPRFEKDPIPGLDRVGICKF